MFSMPPARMTWAPPTTISWAAEMMACRPEPQTRLSVMPGTRLGRPAFRATCRPGFIPWPACNTFPTITWSTCPGCSCASSNIPLATVAPRSEAGISLSMPPKVPIAVLRGVEMTISCMLLMTCSFRECQLNCDGRGIASERSSSWGTLSLATGLLEQESYFKRHLILNLAMTHNPASLLLDLKPRHIAQRLHRTFDGPLRTVIEPHGGGPDKLRFPVNFAFLTSHTRFLLFPPQCRYCLMRFKRGYC